MRPADGGYRTFPFDGVAATPLPAAAGKARVVSGRAPSRGRVDSKSRYGRPGSEGSMKVAFALLGLVLLGSSLRGQSYEGPGGFKGGGGGGVNP